MGLENDNGTSAFDKGSLAKKNHLSMSVSVMVGHGEGFFVGKPYIAVVGINEKKCFTRAGSQRRKSVDGGGRFTAAAGRDDDVELIALQIGRI